MREAAVSTLQDAVRSYLDTLDQSLERLSHGNEGMLGDLPSWALTTRRVIVGVTPDSRAAVVRIIEDESLETDVASGEVIADVLHLNNLIAPWETESSLAQLATTPFAVFGDMFMFAVNKPLSPPLVRGRELIGWGAIEGALKCFSIDEAKREAIDLWNKPSAGLPSVKNFVMEVQSIFARFHALVRRKAFLERRIHRFINTHARLLLPPHLRSFPDYALTQGSEVRRADLILERSAGTPALLIELESPVHSVLRANGDLTAQANHAKAQIAEWDEFIHNEPQRNADGDMSFLRGKRDRLVIIGRGLERRDELLKSRFTDTTIWTYDLLIQEAKRHWNETLLEQYRLLGLPPQTAFR